MMDAKTLDALKASIAHWQENLAKAKAGERFETGPSECALCHLFFFYDACCGCPVEARTGLAGCRGTPYDDVFKAIRKRKNAHDLVKSCEAEVEFLQSLLPPGALP